MSESRFPTDDRQLDEILAEYLRAVEMGTAPSEEDLISRHPELADQLREFFADKQQIDDLAGAADGPEKTIADPHPPTPIVKSGSLADIERNESFVGESIRYFGDYELLEEIARGGMGVVYKARQVSLNRVVALKMILAGQLAGDEQVRRFYAEAEAAANLNHTAIVPIYEVGQHESQHYYSMAYVEGQSLADRLSDGPLSPKIAAKLVEEIAEAIAFAHDQGMIHRDLKPGNVLLDGNGNPCVTDFGLAKKIDANLSLTATGQILGTPGYMAPEQVRGDPSEVGPSADVYGLGAILYAALTGQPPFQASTPMETLLQVLNSVPTSVRQINTTVDQDLETICLKCLERDERNRYDSASELADDLTRWLSFDPINARPVGRMERTRRWVWRKRRPIAAGIGAAACMAAVIVAMVLTQNHYRNSSIRKVARAFVEAVSGGDEARITSTLSERARKNAPMSQLIEPLYFLVETDPRDYIVGHPIVSGSEARVPITVASGTDQQQAFLRLRREQGKWLVYHISYSSGALRIDLDFSNPIWGHESLKPEETTRLQAVTRQAWDELWRIDLNIVDEPAVEVLQRLTEELNISFVHVEDLQMRLARPISINLPRVSRLQAIEEICRRLDIHPRYKDRKLTLWEGVRRSPVAFAGPFLVEVEDVRQFPPHATGLVKLNYRVFGLPPEIINGAFEDMDGVEVTQIRGPEGANLLDDSRPPERSSHRTLSQEFVQLIWLKNLVRRVTSAQHISGAVSVALPTKVQSIRFENLPSPEIKNADQAKVKVEWLLSYLHVHVSGLPGISYKDVHVIAYDEEGKEISQFGSGGGASDDWAHISVNLLKPPSSAQVSIATEIQVALYKFQIGEIALPDYQQMPEALVPASFVGHEIPLEFEFLSLARKGPRSGQVRLRAVNHSDKAIFRVNTTFVYLDADGDKLDDFSVTYPQTYDESSRTVLIGPHESTEFDSDAPFMPDKTESVRVEVKNVVFIDSTIWEPSSNRSP